MDDNKKTREQRLAAALRANLHRRKQQTRARAETDTSQDSEDTGSQTQDQSQEPARYRGKR